MERREFIRRSMLTVGGAVVAASTLADDAGASKPHCLWGAGVQPRGGESHETAFKRLEHKVDRKLKILRCYEDWEDMAPTNYVRWAAIMGGYRMSSGTAAMRAVATSRGMRIGIRRV